MTEEYDFRRGRDWHAMQANARRQWQEFRDAAIKFPCPPPPNGCGMPIGAACVTRLPGCAPGLLKRFPAHPSRMNLARKANQ